MQIAAETCEEPVTAAALHLAEAMPERPLKLLLMDDNSFDRKTISRLSRGSRYNLHLTEATSIADARARIAEERPDMMFLDYRVPDGDGIAFSQQILAEMKTSTPPIVIVTGEGDERTAIRSLRSGVADYLCKDGLSIGTFDESIERCLAARPVNSADLMNEVGRVTRRLHALQEATQRNMHLARAFVMPMAEYAWRAVKPLEGDQRTAEAQRLMRIMQRLTGFLDETLIESAAPNEDGGRQLVDLREIIDCLLAGAPELAEFIAVAGSKASATIAANRGHVTMLLKELLSEALTSVPADRKPEVRVRCARDPNGNPVLCVADNGSDLAERRQALAQFAQAVGGSGSTLPGRTTRMSLCQRLAELNGGQLRMTDADGGGCMVMIRFPKCSLEVH